MAVDRGDCATGEFGEVEGLRAGAAAEVEDGGGGREFAAEREGGRLAVAGALAREVFVDVEENFPVALRWTGYGVVWLVIGYERGSPVPGVQAPVRLWWTESSRSSVFPAGADYGFSTCRSSTWSVGGPRDDGVAFQGAKRDLRGMTQATLSELLQLPKQQRLAVAERLWLSVADEASMPVPEDHKRVLRNRLAEYRAGTLKVVSHEELMRRVREP